MVSGLGNSIGTGKESDIYIAINDQGEEMALKFQRLGRVSFRTVKLNRDYLGKRKSASWLYLSRLASLKEYSYMKALHENGFPVPRPIDYNRHGVLMELIPGTLLNNIRELAHPGKVYRFLMDVIVRFAQHGLIHGDFNEFNIMIKEDESIKVIDFPQMVSIDHLNAEMYFDRDVNCIRTFFEKRFGYTAKSWPSLTNDIIRTHTLDKQVAASGFTKELEKELDRLTKEQEEVLKTEQVEGGDNIENSEEVEGEDDEGNSVTIQRPAVSSEGLGTAISQEVEDTATSSIATTLESGGDTKIDLNITTGSSGTVTTKFSLKEDYMHEVTVEITPI